MDCLQFLRRLEVILFSDLERQEGILVEEVILLARLAMVLVLADIPASGTNRIWKG
jgi:hypothetical protein